MTVEVTNGGRFFFPLAADRNERKRKAKKSSVMWQTNDVRWNVFMTTVHQCYTNVTQLNSGYKHLYSVFFIHSACKNKITCKRENTNPASEWNLPSWQLFPEGAGIWKSFPTSRSSAPFCISHPNRQHRCIVNFYLGGIPCSLHWDNMAYKKEIRNNKEKNLFFIYIFTTNTETQLSER